MRAIGLTEKPEVMHKIARMLASQTIAYIFICVSGEVTETGFRCVLARWGVFGVAVGGTEFTLASAVA